MEKGPETLAGFLERLFAAGSAAFVEAPRTAEGPERAAAAAVLRRAFEADRLDLAGPPLPFDEKTALAAAEWTRRACWFLVSRDEPAEEVERALAAPPLPRSAAEHAAGDLTFRYLPTVHRRARAIAPDDPLARRLAEALRRWPLSGVLADVEGPPTGPRDCGGHYGLRLRYAERLADRERPGWEPADDEGRQVLALVRDALGLGTDHDDDRTDTPRQTKGATVGRA